jgi:hypothetical protein
MALLITHILVVSALFAGAYFLLPRDPILRLERGRLLIRPPLARMVWDSSTTTALVIITLYACGLLILVRVIPAAILVGLVALRAFWVLWRRWHARTVVFDRLADTIWFNGGHVAPASDALVVTASGKADPALELILTRAGETQRWPVPWVDRDRAHTVGQSIAEYLGVPLVGVSESKRPA